MYGSTNQEDKWFFYWSYGLDQGDVVLARSSYKTTENEINVLNGGKIKCRLIVYFVYHN